MADILETHSRVFGAYVGVRRDLMMLSSKINTYGSPKAILTVMLVGYEDLQTAQRIAIGAMDEIAWNRLERRRKLIKLR